MATGDLALFDDEADALDLLDEALTAGHVPLTEAAVRGPGAYLLFYVGALDLYGPLVAARWPIYVGCSEADLGSRLGRHRRSLVAAEGLRAEDFRVIALECATDARAVFAERCLISTLGPVLWNQRWLAGFGSRNPSGPSMQRRGRRSAWDTVHPGRTYTSTPRPLTERDALMGRVVEFLAGPGHPSFEWPR